MSELKNSVIRACAGSGKTYTLIERLMHLLESGARPGEILAITFTRKAAQEMRERLQKRLQESTAPWAQKCLHRMQLAEDENDKLNITTFHGWFSILLAGRRWTKGRYGPAELCEDNAPLHAEAWRRWQARAPAAALDAVLAEYSPGTLHDLLTEQLTRHYNAWRLCTTPPPQADEEGKRAQLHAALQAFINAIETGGNKATQTALDDARAYVEQPNEANLAAVQAAFLTKEETPRKHVESNAAKQGKGVEFQAVITTLCHYLNAASLARVLAFHKQMSVLAEGYLAALAEVKAERNQMSYDDLEYESLHAVREHGDVNALLYRIHRRFRHILVDEFQDTSPLQWQVIKSWLDAAHGSEDAPSVFVVGDIKQAIYRFRHGDIRLFDAAWEFLADHYQSEEEERTVCYRLAPSVLEAVNALFLRIWQEKFPPHEISPQVRELRGRVEWHDLAPEASATTAPAAHIGVVRNPLHTAKKEDDERRQRWADAVAAKTREIIDHWQVQGKDGAPRRVREEDVLLLLPTFTHAPKLIFALQRQKLAVSVQNKNKKKTVPSLVSRDIAALLTALLAPENRLSLAQVLVSPLFALTEEELTPLALADEGLWKALQNGTAHPPRVAAAAKRLAAWRGLVRQGALPVHDLLQRIFAEGNVRARYAAALPEPLRSQMEADLSAVLDLSLAQDGGRQPLLWQFLQALPTPPASGNRGVRLMTVHAAKGLEFPVVIVADGSGFDSRSSAGGNQSAQLFVDWQPDAAAPQLVIFRPTKEKRAFAEELEAESKLEEEEYNNRFYVALTRAQQALVVFSLRQKGQEEKAAPRENARLVALRETMQEIAQSQKGEYGEVWAFGDDLRAEGVDAAADAEEAAPAPPPVTIGTAAAGVAVRQAGELLHQQAALLLRGASAEAVAAATAAPVAAAQQLLQNEHLQKLLKDSTEYEVEAEFANEGKLLRVDLLIFLADAIWVIDYKSGDGSLERYQPQMQTYLSTVAAAYPGKPVHGAFVTPRGFHAA